MGRTENHILSSLSPAVISARWLGNSMVYMGRLVLAKGDAVRVWLMYAATEDQIDEWIWNIRTAMVLPP